LFELKTPDKSGVFFYHAKESQMAKPNYSFEKRKKELDRKRKQEEKQQRKKEKIPGTDTDQEDVEPAEE